MLPISADDIRLFLHVLAATVWVGGQLTVLGLLPVARTLGDDVPRIVGRRFAVVAWPAFAVLVATGIWNLFEVNLGDRSNAYATTLFVKLLLVAATGVGAALHTLAHTRAAVAAWGAVGLFAGLGALFFGVVLAAG